MDYRQEMADEGDARGKQANAGPPPGLELLLAAAAQDGAFRRCLLDDWFDAAHRAGVELTPSERSILGAVPRAQLAVMIDAVALGNPARRRFLQATAATALAVFAGTALAACGNTPEEPPPSSPLPPPVDLEAAQEQARRTGRLLMIVIVARDTTQNIIAGIMPEELRREWDSHDLCHSPSEEIRRATENAGCILWKHEPGGFDRGPDPLKDELVRTHQVTKLPTVLFLNPDGTELHRAVQPVTEEELFESIATAAAMFAKRKD